MPGLNISERELAGIEGGRLLGLEGSIDAYNSELLSQKFTDLLKRNCCRFVVDCASLKFISSSGMGVFLSIEDDLISRKGGLKFIRVPETILNVYQKVGLTDIFSLYPDEASALEDFKREL